MKKNMTCIVCPVGCQLTIDDNKNVTGNRCKRGIAYAVEELTNPTRMLTSTVRIESEIISRLSVKTSQPIPKSLIFEVMKELNTLSFKPPIHIGDVLIKNIIQSDSDLIATRTILE